MAPDPTSVLLSGRGRNTEAAMPAVEEFFRALTQRVRARMVNRSSSNFQVRLSGVEVRTLVSVRDDPRFRTSGVYGLLRYDAPRLPGLVILQRPLLTRIIGAMLGDEDDVAGSQDQDVRPLSPVEARIAQRIFVDVARDLVESWPLQPAPPVTFNGPPGNARVVDVQGADEEVFLATLQFGPDDAPYGLMCITVPTQVLRALGQPKAAGPDLSTRGRQADFGRLMPVEIEVVAEVARLPMRVRDLRALQVGDLLPLGPVSEAVVRVNGRPVITGEPGHAHGQRSIRVLTRLR